MKKQFYQPLELIHAISCPCKPPSAFSKQHGVAAVEADSKVNVAATGRVAAYEAAQKDAPPTVSVRIPWGVQRIKAQKAWAFSTGNGIKIGVLDTGADYQHPDLRMCLARGVNLIHPYRLPYDDNGHGTHVAGTIAAGYRTDGIVGAAPDAIIYPVKAFDQNGTAYVSDIVMAVDWCVRNRMDIINMSFGMKQRSQALIDAVKNAHRNGIIVVASSGNDGKSTEVDYPACLPQVISVAATTRSRKIASFSNRTSNIDIYAPGDKIYSTWLHNSYRLLSGTSMATSHISGVIALLLSMKPGITFTRIKQILRKSARPVLSKSARYGEVDALQALRIARQGTQKSKAKHK